MKYASIVVLLGALVSGCKQPYKAIKSSYKPETPYKIPVGDVSPDIHKKKNIKDMNLAEARVARGYYETINEFEFLEKVLERILKLSQDYQEQAECLYELANIYLSDGKFEKAQELYQKIIDQYPGAPFFRAVRYRAILAHFWYCNQPERDQQCTEKTVALALAYLEDFSGGDDVQRIQEVLVQSYLCLLQAELDRSNFYLARYAIYHDQHALTAAHKRTVFMCTQLIPSLEKLGYGFSMIADDAARLESLDETEPDNLEHELGRIIVHVQRLVNGHNRF